MQDFGGLESFTPGEGGSAAPEQLSEEARQRFAAAAAAMQAIKREERRSKRRDSRVAKTIIQFLSDDRYTHFFVLISRLVARDCPSIFILAILSLINDDCRTVVHDYLDEHGQNESVAVETSVRLLHGDGLDPETNRSLIEWIATMQAVLATEPESILHKLMVDEKNVDGTVLQLSTFVLQDFFMSSRGGSRQIAFEQLHPLTANILQTVFEPFMDHAQSSFLRSARSGEDEDEDQDVTA